jgi:hypothetical protein
MRKGWFLIIMLGCSVLITSGILTAADSPEEIIIEGKTYKSDKKGPVKFSHSKHNTDYGLACTECHHTYKDGVNVWKTGDEVKKCDQCHDVEKTEGNVKKLMTAFHDNCKNCHKGKNTEGKNAPDKKCEDCHLEQNKN